MSQYLYYEHYCFKNLYTEILFFVEFFVSQKISYMPIPVIVWKNLFCVKIISIHGVKENVVRWFAASKVLHCQLHLFFNTLLQLELESAFLGHKVYSGLLLLPGGKLNWPILDWPGCIVQKIVSARTPTRWSHYGIDLLNCYLVRRGMVQQLMFGAVGAFLGNSSGRNHFFGFVWILLLSSSGIYNWWHCTLQSFVSSSVMSIKCCYYLTIYNFSTVRYAVVTLQ